MTAVGAGAVTLVAFVRVNGVLAMVTGAVVLAVSVAATIATAPVVEVGAGELRAGRAHIPVQLLGAGVELEPDATPYWLVSTRRPRELFAAVTAAERLRV
jgi:hypothetical protein